MKKFLLGVVMTVTLAVFCGATFQTTKYSYAYKWLGSGGTNKIKDAEHNAKIAAMTNAGWRLVDIELRGAEGESLYGLFERKQ